MKRTTASLVAFLFASPSYAIDWCAAPGVEGYWKTVEVCDHYPSTQQTKCNYHGKLWGDLGGIIVRDTATYSGNVSCPALLYVTPFQVCAYDEGGPKGEYGVWSWWEGPYPEEYEWPNPACDTFSGDIPFLSRQVLTIEGAVIPGSCHNEQVWVSCD